MNKEEIRSIAIYIGTFVLLVSIIWGLSKFFADAMSAYEVIIPEPGVKCVVVSRVFNTSVDCWTEPTGIREE